MSFTSRPMFPPGNRLYARTIISRFALSQSVAEADQFKAMALEDLALAASQKLFERYVGLRREIPEGDLVIELDCYVFSTAELTELLLEARRLGERDAMCWTGDKP